jgi:hypothetical protein
MITIWPNFRLSGEADVKPPSVKQIYIGQTGMRLSMLGLNIHYAVSVE